MKRVFSVIFFASLTLWLLAVPALRIRRNVTLDDGRIIRVTAYGNKDFDYLLSDYGTVVVQLDSVFHDTELSLEQYLDEHPLAEEQQSQALRRSRKRVGSVASALVKPWGVKKIPVILTAFKDKQFTVARDDARVNAFYDTFFNGTDIRPTTGNYGSVREYFASQSMGQFTPEFTIIGPVELDSAYAYYGGDYNANSKDSCYGKFVKESFTKAQLLRSDWTDFDNDQNGNIDMCVILFAGMGQNYTNAYGDKNTIWPREQPLSYTINGITLSGCSSTCEMRPTATNSEGLISSWQADGIGVAVHEISHALGLPDLYDYNSKEFGLDFWSVMDYGMYTRSSKYPVGYTAYEREFMGWQQTETVTEPTTLHIACFDAGGKGYKIVNEANAGEYYILDNRQAFGWDWGVCSNRGHGMLVMHVDYKPNVWTANRVNTIDIKSGRDHQLLTIIPANGTLIGSNNARTQAEWQSSLKGNPYPGITENHELSDTSSPASIVYTGSFMGKPLVDIEETPDGIINVKVMPLGKLDAPQDLIFQNAFADSLTVVWQPVEQAELYNVRLWKDGELDLEQDSVAFTSFKFTGLRADANYTCSIQAINDKYRNSDWTESEAFRADPDAISDISASAERIRIYDMYGRFIGESFADQLRRFELRHGIYVIRRKDGSTKKLMIQ